MEKYTRYFSLLVLAYMNVLTPEAKTEPEPAPVKPPDTDREEKASAVRFCNIIPDAA